MPAPHHHLEGVIYGEREIKCIAMRSDKTDISFEARVTVPQPSSIHDESQQILARF
jgi:hypothetical protein